ncbi:MAG: AMP-binding protein, partial [Planctomycetales bacterium]|nr:AMP-binding protein [Planctomycetales bacterium]
MTSVTTQHETNVAWQLSRMARQMPDAIAIAAPRHSRPEGRDAYHTMTFRELDEDSTQLAAALQSLGLRPGQRIVLMVRPGIDFISLTFALFKAAAVVVLIDSGMGRQHLLQCLTDVKPDGFIGIPLVQAVRLIYRNRFPQAQLNVTVGRRWAWGGPTLKSLRGWNANLVPHAVDAADPAAIIFTTGSTGPPKGVHYNHGNFCAQVRQIQEFYDIQPGEVDLPGFPLFALFNSAMGTTTVIPDMDPRRPAQVDPQRIVQVVRDWQVTQCFGSPAIWNVVGQYCEGHAIRLPTVRRILSAGAPVPPHVLRRMKAAIADDGDIHTPYGATESLPVASISATEVLEETAAQTAVGAGTCVGRRFSEIEWRVIPIDDEPISSLDGIDDCAVGEIGELIVSGPVVTQQYVTRTESNPLAKIYDGQRLWHRMGDVGYLDDSDRFS